MSPPVEVIFYPRGLVISVAYRKAFNNRSFPCKVPRLSKARQQMESDPLQGLHLGSEIQVYYTLESSKDKVWFPATVTCLNYIHDDRGEVLRGTLSYEPAYGFKTSKAKVTFRSNQEFIQNGHKFSWRFKSSTVVSHSEDGELDDEPDFGSVEDDDDDYAPTAIRKSEKRRKTGVPSPVQALEVAEVQENRSTMFIVRRVERLEQIVSHQRAAMAAAMSRESQVHLPPFLPNGSVPLKFLAARLEEWLKRAPPRPSQSEMTRGTAWFAQESFKAHADCTLLQFDSIANEVSDKLASDVNFNPCLESAKGSIVQEVKVNFKTFASMLQVFGTVSRDIIKDMVVSVRFDRGTDVPVSARVIGCMAVRTLDEQPSSCFITVGESLKAICDDSDAQRHVIYRADCEWDSIEDTYQNPLQSIRLSETQFQERIAELQNSDDHSRACEDKYSFQMKWTGSLNNQRPIFSEFSRGDILGTLHLEVPFVAMKGTGHVKQFLKEAKSLDLFK